MEIRKPAYYDLFRCIAGACPDSCCKEWDVQVDEETADRYRALPGELGDRLRRCLKKEHGEYVMTIVDGRCPMWRADGLCEIQACLGEGALCQTCREFPRLTHDYGDFRELGLELSCPEAARLILSEPNPETVRMEIPGSTEPEYDTDAMAVLLRTREKAHAMLTGTGRPVNEILAELLLYGYQAQGELDGGAAQPFDAETALDSARQLASPGGETKLLEFFEGLEILSPSWAERLRVPSPGQWHREYLMLARYFVDRYWLQAVADYDLVSRVKLAITSCLVIRTLGGDLVRTAQQYSKEIENDVDNVDAILDGACTSPALTDAALLGLLLGTDTVDSLPHS